MRPRPALILLSRADVVDPGALMEAAFRRMGRMVLEDMELMDRGLPPLRGKRAERETVARMRSRPVSRN